MADVLTPEQRRLNMSHIRDRDTKPELLRRRGLHARGLRFRLHRKDLPGCPDLVFPRFHAVVFVHGCFWHGHSCPMFKMPATHTTFWRRKIEQNRKRDQMAQAELIQDHWRVLTVWECSLRGPSRQPVEAVVDAIVQWLDLEELVGTVQGKWKNQTDCRTLTVKAAPPAACVPVKRIG